MQLSLTLKLLLLLNLTLLCATTEQETASSNTSRRRSKRSNFESFLVAHTLNPSDPRSSDYDYWTSRDWEYWLLSRERLHDRVSDYSGTPLAHKTCNAVIVASPSSVERSFDGPLYPYDRYNRIYWSNRRFKTYILQRDYRYNLQVYECGYLYFASRIYRGRPVNFFAAFPTEYDYRATGDLTYELERHCQRVPESTRDWSSSSSWSSNNKYGSGGNIGSSYGTTSGNNGWGSNYGSKYNSYGSYHRTYNDLQYYYNKPANRNHGWGGWGQSYYYSPDTSYNHKVGNGYASGWNHLYTYSKK